MGLSTRVLDFMDEACHIAVGELRGKWIVELGNQHIREDVRRQRECTFSTGKEYYESLGMNHRSIDLNGEDGAEPLNLGKPIEDPDWIGKFDVVTNSGTSDRVYKKYGMFAQWECWRNIHNLAKVGGAFIHVVPRIGHWTVVYETTGIAYNCKFFEKLAIHNHYEIILNGYLTNAPTFDLVTCCLRKMSDEPFMSNKNLFMRWCSREWQS